MLNVYIIIVALVLCGIGFVIYLLMTDKSFQEDAEIVSISDLFSDKNMEIDLSRPLATNPQLPEQPGEIKHSHFNFGRFLRKENSTNSFDDIYNPSIKKEGNSTFPKISLSSLKNNLPIFKRKMEPSDQGEKDLMLTMRANLGLADEPTTSAGSSKLKPPAGGTASLTTSPEKNENEKGETPKSSHVEHQQYSPSASIKMTTTEQKSLDRQIENSIIDSEMQHKYLRLEKILKEQTEEFSRIQAELKNEINNRKNFNHVKDLLEKELADTKEDSRKTQNDLKTALLENENLQKQILLTEEKVKILEKNLSKKECELESILSQVGKAAPKSSSPNYYLSQKEEDNNNNTRSSSQEDVSQSETSIQIKKPPFNKKNSIVIDEENLKDPWNHSKPITMSLIQNSHQKDSTASNEIDIHPLTLSLNEKNDYNENEGGEEASPPINKPHEFLSLKDDIFDPLNDSKNPITLDLRKNHEITNNPEE